MNDIIIRAQPSANVEVHDPIKLRENFAKLDLKYSKPDINSELKWDNPNNMERGINPVLQKLSYDPIKDFAPVALSTANYLVVVSSNNVPFKTFPEMLAWAKANPGKLTVATNGEGGFPHLTFEHLAKAGGISFTHIPYKGSAAIVTDLGGGQVMVGIDGISGPAPHIRSGLIKLLAVTNKTKISTWPNTPTVAESIPNWESNGWFSYSAPAGTPTDIVNKLNAEINRAMKSPEIVEQLATYGLTVVAESPEYFAQELLKDYNKYGKLVKDIGFTPR
jgi:tripartite-type tricarboxylate transporter receptor subunit TctC